MARCLHGWFESPPSTPEPPPIRREFLTLTQARRALAKTPEWSRLLTSDLQMHTVWSDGSGTILAMAEAAIERDYQYIAIADHTRGLKIAGGLDEKRLEQQSREIVQQFCKRGTEFIILRSAETNLSLAAEADMSPSVLNQLDIVLGSFHSALRRKDDQTSRYIAALRNPAIQILGHPESRIYNYCEGLRAAWPRVFAEASRLDKAVEIDGYADRQDLRLSLLKLAREEGSKISLGTDAHHPEQLVYMEIGLAAAALAKVQPEQIINFMNLMPLRKWSDSLRPRSRRPHVSIQNSLGVFPAG
jgi:histidinol phosphatase-like PHP family hydrolase